MDAWNQEISKRQMKIELLGLQQHMAQLELQEIQARKALETIKDNMARDMERAEQIQKAIAEMSQQ